MHSNSKDTATGEKKKKGTKSNVKIALKSTIIALSQAEPDQPNEKSTLQAAPSDKKSNVDDDIYSMVPDEVPATSKQDEIEEDVYEMTDLVIVDSSPSTEKHNSVPQNATIKSSSDEREPTTSEECPYDMARDCFVRTTMSGNMKSPDNETDCDGDDTYSHLATESSPTDQVYDRLERNISDTSDAVYNCLNDHQLSNSKQETRPSFQASSYEDVEIPINQTNIGNNNTESPSTHSDFPEDDDTYEDVSVTFPVKSPASSNDQENDGLIDEDSDDTYEDVSSIPIRRPRDEPPLFERPKLSLDIKPSPINKETFSTKVSPARQVLATSDDTEQKPEATTNEAKSLFKHSKAMHPSQWFSKPQFMKSRQKFDLRKRANSKRSSMNLIDDGVSDSPPENRPSDFNIRSRQPMPIPQAQGRVTSTPRTALADSLEENPLYRSMQEKLRAPKS